MSKKNGAKPPSNGYAFKVEPGQKVNLKDYDADYSADLKKADAAEHFSNYNAELDEIQELLYAAGQNSVLIVLQGMDTSGKDGTMEHVMGSFNPQGCDVVGFKVPSSEEAGHDFLWRIHQHAPLRGNISIFNRSHYEDVLVVRVHDLQPQAVWSKRYEHINNFERLLADNNTIILKFFLHISEEEQLERLVAREEDTAKRWKLSASDYAERQYWKAYQEAYEDALAKCSTDHAPWFIVPANRKWYRNLAVAETLIEQLRPYKDKWRKELEQRGEKTYQAVLEMKNKLGITESVTAEDKA